MEELEDWFLEYLMPLGFHLTVLLYDPYTFVPKRSVLYTYNLPNGDEKCVKLRTMITPELAQDLQAWGRTQDDITQTYRDLIIEDIRHELQRLGLPSPWGPKDFTPSRFINKFKLKKYD
jgi:hypothetical protein